MAKQTVITPAMQINTGRAPSAVNGAAPIGQAVRVDVYFDAAISDVDISMTAIMQNGCFSTVQCIFVDNSLNPASVIITIPGIEQRIIVNGFSQSLEPVYVSDSAASAPIRVHSKSVNKPGFPVSLWFSNVPQPFYSKTALLNSVFTQIASMNIGNSGGGYSYSYTFDLSNVMAVNGVADWPTIWVDNSMGFQHLYVYDTDAGIVIYIVSPYSIAQFPALGAGAYRYSFLALDQVVGGSQTAFSYGYPAVVFFKSQQQPYYEIDSGGSNGGLYSQTWDTALGIGAGVAISANESRKRVGMSAANPFNVVYGGWQQHSVLEGALYVLALDIMSTSTMQRGFTVLNGGTAQTVTIRDRF